MVQTCVAIQWHDVKDKDITNPSKYTILNDNWTITMSDIPLMGLADDVEVFVKRNTNSYPTEDPRLVLVVSTYAPMDKQDSEYPNYRIWDKQYTITERTADDKKASVDTACSNANAQVYSTEKRAQYDDVYSVALRKKTDGIELTGIEKDIMVKKELYANSMVANISIANAKKHAIDEGIPVDLDSDWLTDDPTINV